MKRKMILPLIAVMFAVAGAFASKPVVQMAFYHIAPNSHGSGTIDNTTRECAVGRSVQCKIGTLPAYSTTQGADNEDSAALLKYNVN